MAHKLRVILTALSATAPLLGCTAQVQPELDMLPATHFPARVPLQMLCTARIQGVGIRDLEDDYLPHVVECENRGAGQQALRAQAIASRSVAYWSMLAKGTICDGQRCQVYSCSREPSANVVNAVRDTRGTVLSYGGLVTYGFYVDGDRQAAAPGCADNPGAHNSKWVTQNSGLVGVGVQQSPLGHVSSQFDQDFGQNRGCMSQWGSRCLAAAGMDYVSILRSYFGGDIQLVQVFGPCWRATPDGGEPDDAAGTDDSDPSGAVLRD